MNSVAKNYQGRNQAHSNSLNRETGNHHNAQG